MLQTNNCLRTTHFNPSLKLADRTLSSSFQDESPSLQSETARTYKEFTFVLLIDEYTSETIASSLAFQVFNQHGYELETDNEMQKEEDTNINERNAKLSTTDMYERIVSVQYKFQVTKHCNRIEDFFLCVRLLARSITKTNCFASCIVYENGYRHHPVFLHLEIPCLTSAEPPPLIIGIFRAVMDSTGEHHGNWIYQNESCLFQAFESSDAEPLDCDKAKKQDTADEYYCISQKDTLDIDKGVREKLEQVRKRIIGKSKRTVFYTFSKEDLTDFFLLPRDEVAHELGICVTLLKKICRKNGIKQWPYRKLRSMDARLSSLRRLLSTPDSVSNNRKKFHDEYHLLLNERERILRGNE